MSYKWKRILAFLILSTLLTSLLGCQPKKLEGIHDKWTLNDNSVMQIKEDNTFSWESENNVYVAGDIVKFLEGEDAINAIQVPESKKENLKGKHIYYMSVIYTQYFDNKLDKSEILNGNKINFALELNGKDNINILILNSNSEFTATRGA